LGNEGLSSKILAALKIGDANSRCALASTEASLGKSKHQLGDLVNFSPIL
jgi:hypothetical protein